MRSRSIVHLELQSFFEDYTKLENKEVKVEGIQNKEVALEIVNKSIEDYKKNFLNEY